MSLTNTCILLSNITVVWQEHFAPGDKRGDRNIGFFVRKTMDAFLHFLLGAKTGHFLAPHRLCTLLGFLWGFLNSIPAQSTVSTVQHTTLQNPATKSLAKDPDSLGQRKRVCVSGVETVDCALRLHCARRAFSVGCHAPRRNSHCRRRQRWR